MVTIYYANSSDFQKETTLEVLLELLPEKMRARALRYHFELDSFNYVLGRLLLKRALKEAAVPVEELNNIYYNASEKPLLDSLFFSISHSQNWVACAATQTGDIGLDVELPRKIKREHFKRSFSPYEWMQIIRDESLHTFYTYWTQKEAILKANGEGLEHLLKMKIEKDGTAHFSGTGEETTWHLQKVDLEESGVYSCLCSSEKMTITTKKITPNIL